MNKLTEYFFTAAVNVFTQADVAIALGGSPYSYHGLIKRAIAHGEILNIRRGLYCLAPKYQKKPISVYELAEHIYGPSYISLETALSYHGWIPEAVYTCTSVCYNSAREFTTPLGIFSYKPIPQHTFYFAVERQPDKDSNVFFMASAAKALADYVYLHRLDWTGITEATQSLRIEEADLRSVTPQELFTLRGNYKNSRVKQFLTEWSEVLVK
jgi:predicted transcriptional regulator of viral defense system